MKKFLQIVILILFFQNPYLNAMNKLERETNECINLCLCKFGFLQQNNPQLEQLQSCFKECFTYRKRKFSQNNPEQNDTVTSNYTHMNK